MPDTIETLQQKMEEAARALDFETARKYRDRISLMRGGATAADAERVDQVGLDRQQPGAMSLGTSQQRVTPSADWRPPPKPDPMTSGRPTRAGRRKP